MSNEPGRRDAPEGDEPREPGVPPHQPPMDEDPAEEERRDEEAEESFPSSDPPATGGPGI